MAIEVQCGQCRKRYKVGDALAGRKVKCKNCNAVMVVPGASPALPQAKPTPQRAKVATKPAPKPPEDPDSFEAIAAMAAMEENSAPLVEPPPSAPAAARRGTVYNGPPVEAPPPVRVSGYGTRKKANNQQRAAIWGGFGVAGVIVTIKIIFLIIRSINANSSSSSPSNDGTTPARPRSYVSRPDSEPGDSSNRTQATTPTPTAPPPDWNNVPRHVGTGSDNGPVANGSKQRLGPDGKPIPLPPVDAGFSDAPPAFAEEGGDAEPPVPKRRRGSGGTTAVPSLVNVVETPALGPSEEIRASDRPGPWVFVRRHQDGGARWESYKLTDKVDAANPAGKILLPDGGAEAIFSPGGDYLVRPASKKLDVFAFAGGANLHSIDATGMMELIGFLNADQFVVSGGERATLAIVNAKTGQKVRDLVAPVGMTFQGRECAVSPDGARIAVPVTAEPAPLVLLYNSGGGVDRRLPLAGMEKEQKFWIKPLASSFSPDGKKLAVVMSLERLLRVYCFAVIDGRVLGVHDFFDVWHHGGNASPLVQWLGDTDCLLLRGYVVMDVPTGRVLGYTAKDLRWWHDLGGGRALMFHKPPAGAESLDVCAIDTDLVASRKAWAKAAGPLLFTPGDPLGTKFAATIQPKSGDAKTGAPPDTAPPAKATDAPVPLDAPYANVRQILFGRPDVAAAVVAVAPVDAGRHEWNALRDADSTVQRIDLATGKLADPVHVPLLSKLLATSPDASLAVMVSDAEGTAGEKISARLDVLSLATGKTVASFVPYGDATASGDNGAGNASVHTVTWAGMPDNDGLITLSGGHLLVRWSVAGRRAVWARAGVAAPPAFSPGRRYLAVRQESTLLLVDAKTGEAVGSLAADPINGIEVKDTTFSRDGESFYAATGNGLIRWDVKTGQPEASPLVAQPIESLEDAGGKYLLADGRLFDTEKKSFVFNYSVYGGHHLYGGPAGRHWFVSRTPGDGAPYLCSAVVPGDADAAVIARLAANPPLIRPGVQVALQVNAGAASDKITEQLVRRLKARHLDEGEPVATLRVSAQSVSTGEVVPISNGMSPFNAQPTGESLTVQNYECFYEMVGPGDKVLYGSPVSVIHGQSRGTFMLKQGETVAGKVEEMLVNQVVGWSNTVYIPSYMSADGKLVPRADGVLSVHLPDEPPATQPASQPAP